MADDPKVVNDHIDSVTLPTTELVYEGEAKREFVKKMAKLTVRVNPPPRLFFLILVNVIWTMPKAIPYCCCSVTKWLDGGIAKA